MREFLISNIYGGKIPYSRMVNNLNVNNSGITIYKIFEIANIKQL